ncbi:MAG: Fibronectin type domain protein, partial [Verrucomicrobiales bacterium]|nr:Fibronectin type domain protein [Verrucomicrobiales bacterium]
NGAFNLVETIPNSFTNYTETGLEVGWQYFYELAAVVNGAEVRSAPFAILSQLNGNLIANSGFEESDNSHWDKWDTGNIPWTNMVGSSNAFQGRKSMQVVLQNQTTTDGLNQYVVYGTPRSYIPVNAGTLYSFGGYMQSSGLTALTTNWFEWTSSLTGDNHNARPTFPYPNYFTPPMGIGPTATSWTYLNRVFTMPAGFPNVELRHRFQSALPANGSIYLDDIFFRALPPLSDPHWNVLLPLRSAWRYFTSTPAASWFATKFSDLAWPSGTAKFGAGSGPMNIATTLPTSKASYFFRTTFTLHEVAFEELLLAANCTDDFAGITYPLRVWLNGQEVITSGINAVSSDGNDTKYFDLTPFQNLLVAGVNTIAVQLNNAWASSWDNVSFDVSLLAVPSLFNTIELISAQRTGSNVLLQISAPVGTSLRIESRDALNGPWQLVGTTNATSTITAFSDIGQNGRIAPSTAPMRYYRVVGN